MLPKPLRMLYSEFGSPFINGVEGLLNPADDPIAVLRCTAIGSRRADYAVSNRQV